MATAERISPTELISFMGITPADCGEGFQTAVPWKSKIAGEQLKLVYEYDKYLESIVDNPFLYGPFSLVATMQKMLIDLLLMDPVKSQAREAVTGGKNPDLFSEINATIYSEYSLLLYELCGLVMKDGRFDRKKAWRLSATEEGQAVLRRYIERFASLEYGYNSLGLTRLKAMKEVLKCMLCVITETPLEGEDTPFHRKATGGKPGQTFEEYLDENRLRLENLYNKDAFDILGYSERATGGKIGFCPYEIVKNSRIHGVSLRHYRLPKEIKPNGKILYISTPLINKPELYDLAEGKSVIEGMHKEGYDIYLVDYGVPGPEESDLGLDFYAYVVHDRFIGMVKKMNPGREIFAMGYCMAGTLLLAYLGRRAEELKAEGEKLDIKKIVLMASPVRFDDGESGHAPMREVIRKQYDGSFLSEMFGPVNIPHQVIQYGMNEIQPGVQYTVSLGFYGRAHFPGAIEDSAAFLYWLTHGTKFPARAHKEWLRRFFLGNELVGGTFTLPSRNPALDGKPINMGGLAEAGLQIFDYRGTRDPIAPAASCVASELWGLTKEGNIGITTGGLNRTIEKNIGHIFVVSKQLLGEFLQTATAFYRGDRQDQ